MRLHEMGKPRISPRGGFIPYYIDDKGSVSVYLMIPSDPKYGGDKPQIAKGKIDPGEDALEGGTREAEEELGLKRNNLKSSFQLASEDITGLDNTYNITIFAGEVNNPDDFGQPHYETGWAGWIEIDKALTTMRPNQKKYVALLKNKLTTK